MEKKRLAAIAISTRKDRLSEFGINVLNEASHMYEHHLGCGFTGNWLLFMFFSVIQLKGGWRVGGC